MKLLTERLKINREIYELTEKDYCIDKQLYLMLNVLFFCTMKVNDLLTDISLSRPCLYIVSNAQTIVCFLT